MVKGSDKRVIIIISLLAIVLLIAILIIINAQPINVFGVVSKVGGGFIIKSSVIDCELSNEELILINGFNGLVNQSILIKGLVFGDLLLIQSINDSFNPVIDCFKDHVNDITIKPSLNFSVKSGVPSLFEYNVTNNQDKRLFYECTLKTDCVVSRSFFTGYLNPGEIKRVFFNISCNEGVHESIISTVFVDELRGYHYFNDSLIINSV